MDRKDIPPEMLREMLAGATDAGDPMQPEEDAALQRLIQIAQGDTGGSRRVANFLLAWWNADECGAFDLRDLWGLDPQVCADVTRIFAFLCRRSVYPDTLGYAEHFENLVKQWR